MRDLWSTLYQSITTRVHPNMSDGALRSRLESDMLSAFEVVLRSFDVKQHLCLSK